MADMTIGNNQPVTDIQQVKDSTKQSVLDKAQERNTTQNQPIAEQVKQTMQENQEGSGGGAGPNSVDLTA